MVRNDAQNSVGGVISFQIVWGFLNVSSDQPQALALYFHTEKQSLNISVEKQAAFQWKESCANSMLVFTENGKGKAWNSANFTVQWCF
jgi:hypothetical protein